MQGSMLAFCVVLSGCGAKEAVSRTHSTAAQSHLRCDCYEAAPLKIAPALLSTMRESMRWTARHTTKSLLNFSS
jgi:hypothetical protein